MSDEVSGPVRERRSSVCRGCSLFWPTVPAKSEIAFVAVKSDSVRLVCEEDHRMLHLPRADLIRQLGVQENLDAMIALAAIGDSADLGEAVHAIVTGELKEEE